MGSVYNSKQRCPHSANDNLTILASLTRNSWHHKKVWQLIVKSSANTLIICIWTKFYTFKQTLRVLLVKSEQLSGSFANLGQGELDPPHLTLVPQSILTWKDATVNNQSPMLLWLNASESKFIAHGFNLKITAYQWVSTPGRDGTSQMDVEGWHMSYDKPNSWQRAWRLRCACNISTLGLSLLIK